MRPTRVLAVALTTAALVALPAIPASAVGILIVSGPVFTVTETSATFHYEFVDTADDGDDVECSLDGGAYVPCPDGYTVTGLADGPHTAHFRSPDTAGSTHVWTVDSTGPVVTIDPVAEYVNAVPSPTFSATDVSDIRGFWCEDTQVQLDGVTPYVSSGDCWSPSDITTGQDGIHTYVVRATDLWYHQGQSSITFALDRVLPSVSITADPGTLSGSTAAFDFTAEDVPSTAVVTPAYASGIAATECQLDGAPRTACESGVQFTGLTAGPHSFVVWAVDRAGNETSAEHTWTVDATAPVIAIDAVAAYVQTAPAYVHWSVDDPDAELVCSYRLLNGDTDWLVDNVCDSEPYLLLPDEGAHTVTIRATDLAGNTASLSRSFIVDSTAPVLSWNSVPSAISAGTSASLGVSVDEGEHSPHVAGVAEFECELDGEPLAECGELIELAALGDGEHELVVIATDRAGNASEPLSYQWVVDTVDPVVEFDPVASVVTSRPASIGYTITEANPDYAHCYYHTTYGGVDAHFAAWPCDGPVVPWGPTEGRFEVSVVAVDAAGNEGSATLVFVVDGTAPTVSITSAPPSIATVDSATFAFSADEGPAAPNVSGVAQTQCSLDGATWEPCATGDSIVELEEGAHTFEVRAIDAAGHVSGVASHSWTVDTIPPTVTVSGEPAAYTSSTDASIAFEVIGGDATTCSVDGAPVTCASPLVLTGLADGEHEVVVSAADAGGLTATGRVTWTVDTLAPEVSFTAGPGAVSGASASFQFDVVETTPALLGLPQSTASPIELVECSLDGAPFEACTSPVLLTGLAAGEHRFAVRATDAAGNVGDAALHEWTVDLAVPPAQPRALAATGGTAGAALAGALGVAVLGGALLLLRRRRRA